MHCSQWEVRPPIFIDAQLMLANGILPISMACGGLQNRLTFALRAAGAAAAIILGVFIYIIRHWVTAWIRFVTRVITASCAI